MTSIEGRGTSVTVYFPKERVIWEEKKKTTKTKKSVKSTKAASALTATKTKKVASVAKKKTKTPAKTHPAKKVTDQK